jgi:uncharacterized protein YciI
MQFLVTGMDGTDEGAPERRASVREAHLAMGKELQDSGNMLFAAAILNESGQMVGSSIICDFESREELDAWLNSEPYVTGKVWESIRIEQCKVGPAFLKN